MKSIVLLSSGLDSTVAFKEAYDISDEILCVTFDYGQKAREREISFAKTICERYKAGHIVIELPWYRTFRGALTGGSALPEISEHELDDKEITKKSAENVWVPARNVVFLSIGAALAENFKYDTIVTGFDVEEAATFPDNTIEFVKRFNKMLELGTLTKTSVYAPLISMNKSDIVKRGLEIGAPLEWSWSCYNGSEKPCGTCESCLRRKRAFEISGTKDPLLERLGA
ncbi:MAG: succinoglycan biosynthesis regulator [Candidatus Methanoperedens nitroreducens]|uniref:7-cyano-7-deazaguanine synthase n=1 Tax=Candidatus Methanoperedens nitratireducens TaxID=1392998 RepID=A0A0P8AGV4_9EURY|nr:7-cyano-7-deazaguanine synthase QueC [Candidatus Methanoperedens sp. BLZ2]KAB2948435.1 MAG: 7-cyano-7-deazaguanine synthase QueC [Candidatus Methanoperedens sp.]KPQ43637.1 MAG: succinoglycan biosynthesis regulator [Candidatus Methanoperedens sp. BLZ1]MBZ0174473.1 7-cyano-7-deazaguanine synthase QueC [Candidatus Methanoperedens nitroreducens]MCX9078495.1 7-cyano-7-deazaguanine synthase QueC [Candidatus Methanoperedens sp.]MCX9087954.1 7-cyano-7-deazaguanine synthase QueC [Candidatus Methanop